MADCVVVCSWLGNSPKVAQRSYLLVTSADFQKAISGGEKSGTKSGTIGAKNGTKSCTARASTCSQEIAIEQGNHSRNITFPGKSIGLSADGEGFEYPSNPQGKVDFPDDVARNPARSQMESLLIELWASATDAAKLQALELLRNNPTQNPSQPTNNRL